MTEPQVSAEDVRQAQRTLAGHVEATDEDVRVVFATYPDLYFKATMWGWNDTEVRDELCAAVERQNKIAWPR